MLQQRISQTYFFVHVYIFLLGSTRSGIAYYSNWIYKWIYKYTALHSFIYAKNFFKVIISIYIFTSNVCEYSFPLFPHHFFFFLNTNTWYFHSL